MGISENSGLDGILYAMAPRTIIYITCKLPANGIRELMTASCCPQRGRAETRTLDSFTMASHSTSNQAERAGGTFRITWEQSDKSGPCLILGFCKWIGLPSQEEKIDFLARVALKHGEVKT